MTPLTPEAAWKLVNDLADAARRHEAAMFAGKLTGWDSSIAAEHRCGREIVMALTGLSSARAECCRPTFVPAVADAVVGPDPYGEAAGASIDHALTRVA